MAIQSKPLVPVRPQAIDAMRARIDLYVNDSLEDLDGLALNLATMLTNEKYTASQRNKGKVRALKAEVQRLRAERRPSQSTETLLRRRIFGQLKATINEHGPITCDWIGSAAKRIYSDLAKHDFLRTD